MLNEKPYGKSIYYLLILLLGAVLAFWPLSFHVFSLKNDALNYFLPVRWQVSEAIANGFFPYWSPYFNLGYSLHGDMQSGVWNPFVWFFSIFGPYTLYSLQLETLLYIFISGAGMFFLLKHFRIHPGINLMCSFGYMLCGFNTDSTQFLNWISGAAFLPFVILFYYRLLHESKVVNALATALFCYLIFVTAYPAHVVMLMYILLFMFIWHFTRHISLFRKKENSIPFIRNHLVLVIGFVMLSLPAILSYSIYLPLSERGAGASYQEVMSDPLHPYFLISYFFPLPVFIAPFGEVNDPLTRNCYFGLITLFFCLVAFFIKSKNPWVRFCKWAFLISILFSLGEWFGLRIAAYYLLPMMDTFRHPSSARLFAIFFGCIIGAFAFNEVLKGRVERKHLMQTFRLVLAVSIVAVILCCVQLVAKGVSLPSGMTAADIFSSGASLKKFVSHFGFFEILFINVLLQLPFLYILYRKAIKSLQWKYVTIAGIANSMLIATMLMPFPVVKKDRAAYIQQVLDKSRVASYPLPELQSSLQQNSLHGMDLFDEIGTLNMYNKKPGRVDYRISPSNLNSQNEFWFNPSMRGLVMNYPLLYRADSAALVRDTALTRQLQTNEKYVFVERRTLADSINSFSKAKSPVLTVETFNPDYFRFRITSENAAYFILLQNYFPLWRIHVDNAIIKPDKVNVTFMGFFLPAGQHIVEFKYDAGLIPAAVWISVLSLLLIVVYLFRHRPYH